MGFLSTLFSTASVDPLAQDKAYQGLTQSLKKSYKKSTNLDPTGGLIYRSGKAALDTNLRDRARQDDARLAARGATGTELDIAMGANRNAFAANSGRNLLGIAAQDQRVREQTQFRNLMGVLRSLDANEQFTRKIEESRRGELMRAITGGAMNLTGAIAGMPGMQKLPGQIFGKGFGDFIGSSA